MRATRLHAVIGVVTTALLCAAGPAPAGMGDTYNRTEAGLPLTNSASQTLFEFQGRRIADFRVAAGGFSAIQRRGIVRRRLTPLLATSLMASDVQVVQLNRELALVLKGEHLLTVCEADARANDSTVDGLAEQWADNLREAIRLSLHAPWLEVRAKLEPTGATAEGKTHGR